MPLLGVCIGMKRNTHILITISAEAPDVRISGNKISGNVTTIEADIEQQLAKYIDNMVQEAKPGLWHTTWWGIVVLGVAVTIISAGILYWIGWLG